MEQFRNIQIGNKAQTSNKVHPQRMEKTAGDLRGSSVIPSLSRSSPPNLWKPQHVARFVSTLIVSGREHRVNPQLVPRLNSEKCAAPD